MSREQAWRQGVGIGQHSQSKREMSSSFERREVDLKLEKKSSMGRNYL